MKRIILLISLGLLTLIPGWAGPEAALATGEEYEPQANPEAVITSGRARFTVLTPQMIRIQFSTRQQFEDRATFAVVNRRLPVPRFTSEERDGRLTIKTDAVTLSYKIGGTISSGAPNDEVLTIQFQLGGRTVTWYPGKDDALNLKGTTRTLDGQIGDNKRQEMENGLLSRAGWSIIDESPRTRRGDGSTTFAFDQRYDGIEWSSYPTPDHQSRENEMGELFAPLNIEQPMLSAVERSYRISRNEFFITVAALAVAAYNRKNDIKLSWIYNGREDVQSMNSVGLLFRDLPVAVRLRSDMTLRDLFADVHEQVQKAIEHSCYPYVDTHNQVASQESAYLLYQQDIRDMSGMDGMNIETVDVRQNQAASQTILDMEILDGAEGLILMIDYAASRYENQSIERFKDIFAHLALAMVTHNSQADVTVGELLKKSEEKQV